MNPENPITPNTETTAQPPASPLHDAVDVWGAEAAGNAAPALTVVRVDANERLIIPFTSQVMTVSLHYLETAEVNGYVHCLGIGCMLCKAGKKNEQRDLLPVYDVEEQAVGVLAVSPNLRPHALRPQLMPVLRQVKEQGSRLLLTISRPEFGRYQLSHRPLPADADDGAACIRDFMDRFNSGTFDLASVFPQLSNEDLAAIPKIDIALRAKGIKLQ